jgi:hypothetical protein
MKAARIGPSLLLARRRRVRSIRFTKVGRPLVASDRREEGLQAGRHKQVRRRYDEEAETWSVCCNVNRKQPKYCQRTSCHPWGACRLEAEGRS